MDDDGSDNGSDQRGDSRRVFEFALSWPSPMSSSIDDVAKISVMFARAESIRSVTCFSGRKKKEKKRSRATLVYKSRWSLATIVIYGQREGARGIFRRAFYYSGKMNRPTRSESCARIWLRRPQSSQIERKSGHSRINSPT